jgi:alpha-glucan, water dikinase
MHTTHTHTHTHTCRSDCNGEDLEGYAGAGLYESITMDATQLVRVDYSDDPITADPDFRRKV